jgi:hypothetical protein
VANSVSVLYVCGKNSKTSKWYTQLPYHKKIYNLIIITDLTDLNECVIECNEFFHEIPILLQNMAKYTLKATTETSIQYLVYLISICNK